MGRRQRKQKQCITFSHCSRLSVHARPDFEVQYIHNCNTRVLSGFPDRRGKNGGAGQKIGFVEESTTSFSVSLHRHCFPLHFVSTVLKSRLCA